MDDWRARLDFLRDGMNEKNEEAQAELKKELRSFAKFVRKKWRAVKPDKAHSSAQYNELCAAYGWKVMNNR